MYPSGSLEPSPKKNCSICSSMIFWDCGSSGFSRYSFISIFECSIHIFQASWDTLSYTRLPRSPFQGIRSRPGRSFPNFAQWTTREPGLGGSLDAAGFAGPQDSSAMIVLPRVIGTGQSHTILQVLEKSKLSAPLPRGVLQDLRIAGFPWPGRATGQLYCVKYIKPPRIPGDDR